MKIIETERLKLIPFSLELKKIALQDPTKLAQKLGVGVPASWPGPDFAEALPFFIGIMEKDASGSIWDGIVVHKTDELAIGTMGFKGGPDESGAVEIGYSIIPEYHNQGYATEMARHLIAWAFAEPGIKAVMAECLSDNIGSIRVLEKVGMRRLALEDNMLKWELRKSETRP